MLMTVNLALDEGQAPRVRLVTDNGDPYAVVRCGELSIISTTDPASVQAFLLQVITDAAEALANLTRIEVANASKQASAEAPDAS